MSNFFRHLLQRSLSPASATVQPRLASRFESGPAPARLTEERRETSATAPVTAQPATSPPPLSPAPRREILSPVASVPVATISNNLAQVPTSTALVSLPAVSNSSAVTPPPPAIFPALVSAVSVPVSIEPRAILSLPPIPTNTLLVEPIIERIREISPPSAAAITSPASNANAPHPPTAFAPTTRSFSPTPPSTSLARLTPIATAPAPTPTIQVTIGRVDIRAIHAPSAPAARAPGPARRPLVSLEHYLNQRDSK